MSEDLQIQLKIADDYIKELQAEIAALKSENQHMLNRMPDRAELEARVKGLEEKLSAGIKAAELRGAESMARHIHEKLTAHFNWSWETTNKDIEKEVNEWQQSQTKGEK